MNTDDTARPKFLIIWDYANIVRDARYFIFNRNYTFMNDSLFQSYFRWKKKYIQISQFHPLRRYDVILFFLFIYIHLFLKTFAQFIFLACENVLMEHRMQNIKIEVFQCSFSEAIPIFFNRFKNDFSLVWSL